MFLILAMRITRCTLDIQMSSHHVGRVDCPALGKELLENFKLNNAHLWEKLSVSYYGKIF